MFGKIKETICRSPVQSIPLIIGALLFTAAINIYVVKVDNDRLADYKEDVSEQHTQNEWDEISSYINLSYLATKQNSKFLAQKVELDLIKKYGDLEDLKSEFESKEFTTKFYDTLQVNLLEENTTPSSIYPVAFNSMVGMDSGVIAVFSNDKNSQFKNDGTSKVVSWEHFIVNNPNPGLAKKAIRSILNQEDQLIFWQDKKSDDLVIDQQQNMKLDTLKQAYDQYGIEGLRYYSVLSSSYITDNGDIFETNDNDFMIKNDTYKIILVQSFNIGDLLRGYEKNIISSEKETEKNISFIDDFIQYKHTKALVWTLILFLISVLLINLYNSDRKRNEHEESKSNLEGGKQKIENGQ